MEKSERKVVVLTDYEYHVMIGALAEFRNDLLEENREPHDVSELLLKVIDAPVVENGKGRFFRGSR